MEIRTIKEDFNPEIALLVLCCRVFLKTGDIAELRAFITGYSIKWDQVYHLSRVHRIRPVIFNVLFKVKELVDASTFQLYRSFCINFSSRIFSRKAECDRIIALFQQQGINAHQYKGLDFATLIYKDMSLRESADIDVIIGQEDLKGIIDIMENEGYKMKMRQFYTRFPAQFLKLHKDVSFDKEGAFGGSFNFEFHFRPTKYRMNANISFRQLLGDDYLSPERRYDYHDYYKLMIINNGLSDFYPTLRSLLDLVFIEGGEHETTAELKKFDLLRSVMSAHLFNLPVAVSNDPHLNNTGTLLLNELLNKQQIETPYLLRNVYPGIKFSTGIRNKWNVLLKSFLAIITPGNNDISRIRLPYYNLYYITRLFGLIARRVLPHHSKYKK
jgi:hypothetical protein